MESVQVMTAQVDPEVLFYVRRRGRQSKEQVWKQRNIGKTEYQRRPAMQELAKELQKAFPTAKRKRTRRRVCT